MLSSTSSRSIAVFAHSRILAHEPSAADPGFLPSRHWQTPRIPSLPLLHPLRPRYSEPSRIAEIRTLVCPPTQLRMPYAHPNSRRPASMPRPRPRPPGGCRLVARDSPGFSPPALLERTGFLPPVDASAPRGLLLSTPKT